MLTFELPSSQEIPFHRAGDETHAFNLACFFLLFPPFLPLAFREHMRKSSLRHIQGGVKLLPLGYGCDITPVRVHERGK